jgi:hypothetical protein
VPEDRPDDGIVGGGVTAARRVVCEMCKKTDNFVIYDWCEMCETAISRICAIGNEIQAHRFMLAAEADRCRRINWFISVPLHVINAITGSGSAFSASMNYHNMSWQEFLLNMLVILATILNGMNAALGFAARLSSLDTSFFKVNELANRVQNFIVNANKKHDSDIAQFLETLTLEYEHALQAIPVISNASKQMLGNEMKTLGEDVSPDTIRLIQVPNARTGRPRRDVIQTPMPKHPHITISAGSDTSDPPDDLFKKDAKCQC